jgi:MYXO-CTERM domain-containing protein
MVFRAPTIWHRGRMRKALLLGLFLSSCPGPEVHSGPDARAATPVAAESDPVDVVAARTLEAFHPDEGGWSAHTSVATVRVRGERIELSIGPNPDALVVVPIGATRIERGAWRPPNGTTERLSDGTLARTPLERWRTTEHGLEQSWSFARMPDGRGDLVVEVPIASTSLVASTPTGLHLRHDGGTIGLRYGHATWIDAAGRRTAVTARWNGGVVVLRVPERLVTQSQYPAVLDPALGPEIDIDEPVVFSSARSSRDSADIASDGTNYLAVWSEQPFGATTREIWGQRVNASGETLDGHGFRIIDRAGSHEREPTVAFDGTNYMVAYRDLDSVRVTRVSPSGTVLDPEGIVVHSEHGTTDIAFGGGVYFVVWTQLVSPNSRIFAKRVAPDGTVLDATPLLLSAGGTESAIQPSVAYGGGRFLTMWIHGTLSARRQYVRRVSVAGVIEDPAPVVVVPTPATNVSWTAVASDGSDFLALTTHSSGIEARRIRGDGTFIDAAPVPIAGMDHNYPLAAFDGSQYVIGYVVERVDIAHPYTLVVRRLDPVTMALGPEVILDSAWDVERVRNGLVAGGGRAFAVWSSDRDVNSIRGARIDWSTGAHDEPPLILSPASNRQNSSRIAWNGSAYLLLWSDHRFLGSGVYGMRLARDGTPLDPIGTQISPGGTVNFELTVHGSEWVVQYFQQVMTPTGGRRTALMARRIASDGSFVGAPFELLGNRSSWLSGENWDLASNGSSFLFVWTEFSSDLRVRRLATDGAPIDAAPIDITTNGGSFDATAVGDRWFLAFDGINTLSGICLTRIEADGTILDATPIRVHPSANVSNPAIAPGPSGVLIRWRDAGFPIPALQAARVGSDGTVLDPGGGFTVMGAEPPNVPSPPVWDGMRWPIAWADATESIHVDYAEAGTASAGPIVVAHRLSGPSIASDAAGSTVVSYTRWVEVPHRQERLFVRVLTEGGFIDGSPCGSDAECSSGFCADGVCCDSACGASAIDCQACSMAAGAIRNGACTIFSASSTCRAAAGPCDLAEQCNGVEPLCPVDAVAPDGTDCDDAMACNGAETCVAGACSSSGAPMCEDGDACTADACVEPTGCTHTAVADCCAASAECDDADVCTTDVCTANACEHETIAGCCLADEECDDGDSCSVDRCEDRACVHDAACCVADADCDDGDACTTDACAVGNCEHEARADCCAADSDCDDSDACTIDLCDDDGACSHEPSPDCEEPAGCGCSAAPGRPPWLLSIAIALSWLVRRRRSL